MWAKQVYNLLVLSFAFMFVFTAFQTVGNLQKAVLDAVKQSDPNFTGDGYTSLAIVYALFAVCNWVAPSIITIIGPRVSMIVGACGYLGMIAQFLYPLTWLLYLMSGILGAMAAIIWTAQGHYMSLNAGKEKISLHAGVFWAILQCSLLIGNIYIYVAFYGKIEIDEKTRYLVFVVLTCICCVGLVLFLFLRPAVRADGEVIVDKPNVGPVQAFKNALRLFVQPEMALFCVTFFYTGINLSFWSGVYSSAIGATLLLSNSKALIGLSGIFLGIGEITGGLIFGILGKYTARWGRPGVIILAIIVHLITFAVIFVNLPDAATKGDTHDSSIIQPNEYIAIMCSFLLGLADAMFNTQIYAAIGIIFSDETAAGFAIFKFTQSVGAAAGFFYSVVIGLRFHLLIQVIVGILGAISYNIAEYRVKRRTALTQ